jgi:hypothetical protein
MPEAVPARKPAGAVVEQPPKAAAPAPTPVARSDDPYDPAVFNRAMQPRR